jgi:hypothetical protein
MSQYETYTFEVVDKDIETFKTLLWSIKPEKTIRSTSLLEKGKQVGNRYHIPLTQIQYDNLKYELGNKGLKFKVYQVSKTKEQLKAT